MQLMQLMVLRPQRRQIGVIFRLASKNELAAHL